MENGRKGWWKDDKPVDNEPSFKERAVPTMREYLMTNFRERTPRWLVCGEYSLEQFFNSRTVFYPGADRDGHAVRLFNSSRTAHCFVYADLCYDRETVLSEEPLGYRLERVIELPPESFAGGVGAEEEQREELPLEVSPLSGESFDLFALLAMYQRRPEYDRTHGGFRIAVLFVRAEANALYQRLYGRLYSHQPPFAVLLIDIEMYRAQLRDELRFHNPDGPMATVAIRTGGFPQFLLVGYDDGKLWHWRGYDKVDCEPEFTQSIRDRVDCVHECGDFARFGRVLYRRSD